MAVSLSGRLAPRWLGGGDGGISGSRTGPGARLLDRSRRRSRSCTKVWDWNRSVQRGLERIIGTLLGLALAGAVLWVAPQGLWLALMLAALQFLIFMLVVGNYALAVVFITAARVTMASGGHAVENIAALLWARAIDTIIGCTIGIGVLLVTAPRAVAVPIPQELAAALVPLKSC